ncbi:hypothetical protein FACS189442_4510 [Spirochaetia bacterium]|nr:hypothetical protein FACS189442_4510 [Spirochaetia bacterium]
MRQKFYIYRRKGNPVYYARFYNEVGGTLTERSTGCKGRDAAVFTVSNWLRDGLPANKRRGNKVRHIETEATLQGILGLISKADALDADAALEIVKALRERGLISTPAVVALAWASREGVIPHNPAERLTRFTGGEKKRGVLTPAEAADVFAVAWPDKRAFVGNLLAMTCGIRAGEVLALRKSDISADGKNLNIGHSWGRADGLKSPKNGEERKVPLLPEVKSALVDLVGENPWGDDDGFMFYSIVKPNVPMDHKFLIDGLRGAIDAVNTDRKAKQADAALIDWKARNITFHSHRHFYAARMMDKMKPEEIMRVTGHKTEAVFEGYADHVEAENLDRMREAAAETFGNIVKFPVKKGT